MKKVLLWLGGIFLVLFLIIVGLAVYFLMPVSVSSEARNKVLAPIPQPGPDDAYIHYEAMVKDMETPKKDVTFEQITDPDGDLRPEDIQVAKQILSVYQERINEMELGAQKKVCTLPDRPLPEGEIPFSLVTGNLVSETYSNQTEANSNTQVIKNVGVLINIVLLRERVAVAENRPEDAIKDCKLVLQVGRHFSQGTMVHRMIGISMQVRALKKIRQLLTPPTSVAYAESILKALDDFTEPMIYDEKDIARYEVFMRMKDVTGLNRAAKMILEKIGTPNMASTKLRYEAVNARYGLCRLSAAVRMYQAANNQEFPSSLKDLSPGMLTQFPVDPFTNKDFVYEAAADKNSVTISSPGPQTPSNDPNDQKQVETLKKDLFYTLAK